MSLATPTPIRLRAPSLLLRSTLHLLEEEGWQAEIVKSPVGGAASFSLLAYQKVATSSLTVLVHGLAGRTELLLNDVWALVAQRNDLQADDALFCLEPTVRVSRLAQETADRLGLRTCRVGA